MGRPPQTPSRGWKQDVLDVVISLAVAVVMLCIGVSTGQTVFVPMAGAMVLIRGGEALGHRRRGSALLQVGVGRAGRVASFAYAVFACSSAVEAATPSP